MAIQMNLQFQYSVMMSEQLSSRQLELLREIQAVSINCFICKLSQELSRCEILVDQSKCKKDICIECFKKHKKQICINCAQSLEDHYKKGKTSQKNTALEDASKLYNRQFKIRSIEEFQQLDHDFISLIAYFHIHPQGKKYSEPERQIKRILENQKKQQRTIVTEATRVKQAHYIGKTFDPDKTGKESCGCPVDYYKGMTLIRRVFNVRTLETSNNSSQ